MKKKKQEAIKMFTAKEINDLRKQLGEKSLTELETRLDELLASQNDMSFELDADTRAKLQRFFESEGIWSVDFRLAKGLRSVKTLLENPKNNLTVLQLRILQETFLKHTTITSLQAAEIVDDALTALNQVNIEMSRFEEEAKHVAEFLQRKEKESNTGLEHKEDDSEVTQIANEKLKKAKLQKA